MPMTPYDWTQFKRQVFLKTSPETAFRMWATADDIVRFFIKDAINTSPDGDARGGSEIVQPGDRYAWEWHQDLRTAGEFLEVVENERLKFTFGSKTPGSEEKITVTITVEPLEDGFTLMELTQNNMADSEESRVGWHMQCNLGWSFFMTNLKAVLEHGADLREHETERAYASRALNLYE